MHVWKVESTREYFSEFGLDWWWYHGTMVPWYHHGTMVPPWWERWAVLGSKALTKAILGLTRREITEHKMPVLIYFSIGTMCLY